MFTRLRRHFGIPGVIAVIALVFAMLGGAYAATQSGKRQLKAGGVTAAEKKLIKQYAIKYAKEGKQGPAGQNGANGAAGANGKDGQPGKPGEDGEDGEDGKSVLMTTLEAEVDAECEERGGALLEEEGVPLSATEICNGEKGEDGIDGSPWVVGGLPPGATETGSWSFNAGDTNSTIFAPITFSVPLLAGLAGSHVHFQDLPNPTAFEEACPGGGFGVNEPSADPGELCVYSNAEFEPEALTNATFQKITRPSGTNAGASKPGAVLWFEFSGSAGEPAHGFGSFAVTGCGSLAIPCP